MQHSQRTEQNADMIDDPNELLEETMAGLSPSESDVSSGNHNAGLGMKAVS